MLGVCEEGGEEARAVSAATFREALVLGLVGGGDACDPQMLELFRAVPFLRGCRADAIERLARGARPALYAAGDVLCLAGTPALACYVVARGEVEITCDGTRVAVARARDVVGEHGPRAGRVRLASATALTEVLAYAVSRQELLSLARHSRSAAAGMFVALRGRYAGNPLALCPRLPL